MKRNLSLGGIDPIITILFYNFYSAVKGSGGPSYPGSRLSPRHSPATCWAQGDRGERYRALLFVEERTRPSRINIYLRQIKIHHLYTSTLLYWLIIVIIPPHPPAPHTHTHTLVFPGIAILNSRHHPLLPPPPPPTHHHPSPSIIPHSHHHLSHNHHYPPSQSSLPPMPVITTLPCQSSPGQRRRSNELRPTPREQGTKLGAGEGVGDGAAEGVAYVLLLREGRGAGV